MKQQIQVSFVDALKKGFILNYCNFKGRASRSEFWWMALACWLISGAAGGLGTISHLSFFMNLIDLLIILPMLGVTVRRLHDIGKGGGYFFIYLIPLVGMPILYILWNCKESEPVANRFGEVPNVVELPN